MSYARRILPGKTYLVTRRCSERRFFMRPDGPTSNAYVYCLAISAKKYKIDVLAFGTMSNHHHIVLVDRLGQLPNFLQYFHRLFAAHQNALRGRWESFWAASEQTSVVELIEPDDVIQKMVYALCNPVAADLVDKVEDWPGPNALASIVRGTPLCAARPRVFFRADGKLDETAKLEFARPPGHKHMTQAEFGALVKTRIREREAELRRERSAARRKVLGRQGVLAQRWSDRPRGHEPRRVLSPRVACRDKWARIEALRRDKEWLQRYEVSRLKWLAGLPDIVFPAGVWWLARKACVRCEEPCESS